MNTIKTSVQVFAIIPIFFLFTTCENTQDINEQEERDKILELHNLQRKYHFEKMPEEFASLMSQDHISVNRGEIRRPTKQSNIERFTNYFNAVEFEKWDDITPPVIRFSDDYTVAYTVVSKDVITTHVDEKDEMVKQQTEYSWVAIYKKIYGEWTIDCVASTNKPSVINPFTE